MVNWYARDVVEKYKLGELFRQYLRHLLESIFHATKQQHPASIADDRFYTKTDEKQLEAMKTCKRKYKWQWRLIYHPMDLKRRKN